MPTKKATKSGRNSEILTLRNGRKIAKTSAVSVESTARDKPTGNVVKKEGKDAVSRQAEKKVDRLPAKGAKQREASSVLCPKPSTTDKPLPRRAASLTASAVVQCLLQSNAPVNAIAVGSKVKKTDVTVDQKSGKNQMKKPAVTPSKRPNRSVQSRPLSAEKVTSKRLASLNASALISATSPSVLRSIRLVGQPSDVQRGKVLNKKSTKPSTVKRLDTGASNSAPETKSSNQFTENKFDSAPSSDNIRSKSKLPDANSESQIRRTRATAARDILHSRYVQTVSETPSSAANEVRKKSPNRKSSKKIASIKRVAAANDSAKPQPSDDAPDKKIVTRILRTTKSGSTDTVHIKASSEKEADSKSQSKIKRSNYCNEPSVSRIVDRSEGLPIVKTDSNLVQSSQLSPQTAISTSSPQNAHHHVVKNRQESDDGVLEVQKSTLIEQALIRIEDSQSSKSLRQKSSVGCSSSNKGGSRGKNSDCHGVIQSSELVRNGESCVRPVDLTGSAASSTYSCRIVTQQSVTCEVKSRLVDATVLPHGLATAHVSENASLKRKIKRTDSDNSSSQSVKVKHGRRSDISQGSVHVVRHQPTATVQPTVVSTVSAAPNTLIPPNFAAPQTMMQPVPQQMFGVPGISHLAAMAAAASMSLRSAVPVPVQASQMSAFATRCSTPSHISPNSLTPQPSQSLPIPPLFVSPGQWPGYLLPNWTPPAVPVASQMAPTLPFQPAQATGPLNVWPQRPSYPALIPGPAPFLPFKSAMSPIPHSVPMPLNTIPPVLSPSPCGQPKLRSPFASSSPLGLSMNVPSDISSGCSLPPMTMPRLTPLVQDNAVPNIATSLPRKENCSRNKAHGTRQHRNAHQDKTVGNAPSLSKKGHDKVKLCSSKNSAIAKALNIPVVSGISSYLRKEDQLRKDKLKSDSPQCIRPNELAANLNLPKGLVITRVESANKAACEIQDKSKCADVLSNVRSESVVSSDRRKSISTSCPTSPISRISTVNRAPGTMASNKKNPDSLSITSDWTWQGKGVERKVYINNEDPPVTRLCFPSVCHSLGDIIKPRYCVLLASGKRKSDRPYIAKVSALWQHPESGEKMMSLMWYYRPGQVELSSSSDNKSASSTDDSNSSQTVSLVSHPTIVADAEDDEISALVMDLDDDHDGRLKGTNCTSTEPSSDHEGDDTDVEEQDDEIYASRHRDIASLACVEDRCYVLTYDEYCRYRKFVRMTEQHASMNGDSETANFSTLPTETFPAAWSVPPPSPSSENRAATHAMVDFADSIQVSRKDLFPDFCVAPDRIFLCRRVYDSRHKRMLKNPS